MGKRILQSRWEESVSRHMKPKPWQFDGVLTCGPGGRLVQVVEPRWWNFTRWLEARLQHSVHVRFVQNGQVVTCMAKYVREWELNDGGS